MVNINKRIYNEIEAYCKLNNIEDITFFVNKMVVNGFNIEKYGMLKSKDESKPKEQPKPVEPQPAPVQQVITPVQQLPQSTQITIKDDDYDRYNELYDRL